MVTYKLTNDDKGNSTNSVLRSDGWSIPFDPDNTDYQAYLKFLEEGGQPLPAEENQ
jgi:hypothetical protein